MTIGTVTSLHLYPVKSCRGIDLDEAAVGPTGLLHDRRWQVSSHGQPLTQRQNTVLATIEPELIDGGLRLVCDGHGSIEVQQPEVADDQTSSLIGIPVPVGDAGDEAAAWLSAVLDDPAARLHAMVSSGGVAIPPPIDIFGGQPIAFGDLAPVLVTNTATLEWLVQHASEAFGMDRFRANVVVATDEPFAEETWDRFTLGDVHVRHGAAWPRCSIPQVDQRSGERHKEPAKVLATHRKVASAPGVPDGLKPIVEGSSIFGIGCAIGPEATMLRVGDALTVHQTRPPMLPPPG